MKQKTHTIILLLILLAAAFIRFWQLGNVPPSPDWDEAALGYNAYSVLTTGKDEYGVFLPRVLRSFDDYKPPLYMYLTIPSIALFGLETWAVRLPSALCGVLAVLGAYYLTLALFDDKNRKDTLALMVALFLALSPWHIQFSRIAFEANVGLTIHIWAIALFLKGVRRRKLLLLSAFLFGLGLYAYHSERVFLPLMAVVLVIMWRKELFQDRKSLGLAVCIGVLTVAPLFPIVFDPNNWTRLSGTSSLSDQTGLLRRSVGKLEDDIAGGRTLSGKIFQNRRLVYLRTLLDGYMSHFSLKWLFLTGDNDRHHAPGVGLLYLVELPFVLYGMYCIWKQKSRTSSLLLTWFFISPIAASPTTELPHAIRTLVFLPTFQIFSAVGLLTCIEKLQLFIKHVFHSELAGKRIVAIIYTTVTLMFGVNIFYYLHMYFVHTNIEYSQFWQYGYKQAVEYAQEHYDEYDKIVVSTKLEQPHMFFLYYLKYDPAAYLAQGGTASGGFAEVRNAFDKYEFRTIDFRFDVRDGRTLYIGTVSDVAGSIDKFIHYLNGKEAMRITAH